MVSVIPVEPGHPRTEGTWTGRALLPATALVTSLGTQAAQLVTLHGEAADRTAFPRGAWPNPTTGRYDDATVTDGDTDWSLAPSMGASCGGAAGSA